MRFRCPSCRNKYTISDGLVADRILTVRCKFCLSRLFVSAHGMLESADGIPIAPLANGEAVEHRYAAAVGELTSDVVLRTAPTNEISPQEVESFPPQNVRSISNGSRIATTAARPSSPPKGNPMTRLNTATVDQMIRVKKLPFHLVLDFGTSFTQAFYSEMGEPLAYPAQPMPSAIAYMDLSNASNPVYRVGGDAIALLSGHPESCVVSFKKLLGSPYAVQVKDAKNISHAFTPNDVTFHFLSGFFLRFAEETHRWPSRVLVTFPVNFTDHQRKTLRELVERAIQSIEKLLQVEIDPALGQTVGVGVQMDEANAAALAHIVEMVFKDPKRLRELSPLWRLLVCDVGGGTTDIVLIEVRSEDKGDPHEPFFDIKCRTIAPTGDYNCGGDVLTTVIVDEIAAILAQKEFRVATQPGDSGDDAAWKKNFSLLFHFANEVKHWLIREERVHLDRIAKVVLGAAQYSLVGQDLAGEIVVKDAVELAELLSGKTLDRKRIEERLAPRIDLTATMMRELLAFAQAQKAEVVLLAGRGAAWPQYAQIAERFGNEVIHCDPTKAKQLVSRGAWYVEYINKGAFELADIEPAAPGTVCPAKIGIAMHQSEWQLKVAEGPEGKPAIVPGVPVGIEGISGRIKRARYPEIPVTIGRQYPGAKVEPIEQHVFMDPGPNGRPTEQALRLARDDHRARLEAARVRAERALAELIDDVPAHVIDKLMGGSHALPQAPSDADTDLRAIMLAAESLAQRARDAEREAATLAEEAVLEGPAVGPRGIFQQVKDILRRGPSVEELPDDEPKNDPLIAAHARAARARKLAEQITAELRELTARDQEIAGLEALQAELPKPRDRGEFEVRLNNDLTIDLRFEGLDGKSVRGIRFGTPAQFFDDASVWRTGTGVLANLKLSRG